jgi:hypothetical protein
MCKTKMNKQIHLKKKLMPKKPPDLPPLPSPPKNGINIQRICAFEDFMHIDQE